MSCWMKVKALRVPCDVLGIEDAFGFCEAHESEPEFDIGQYPDWHFPHFSAGCVAERAYLDYVLSEKPDPDGEGTVVGQRALKKSEKKEYLPVFRKFFPDIDPDSVRYVRYRWYDGTDAPDVYDGDTDLIKE